MMAGRKLLCGRSTYKTVVERHGYGILPCFGHGRLETRLEGSSGGVVRFANRSRKVGGSSNEVARR